MIIPDLNLLVYAYNEDAPSHAASKAWWERSLSETRPVGIPWVILLGFVRLMSNRRVLVEPMPAAEAVAHCRAWLARPNARLLLPGPGHLDLLAQLLDAASAGADLTTDAHLAALAIEHQAELHSNDSDFARFPGLRWRNPLASMPSP
jgi:toxin-antitoxin system PIN domain toxin